MLSCWSNYMLRHCLLIEFIARFWSPSFIYLSSILTIWSFLADLGSFCSYLGVLMGFLSLSSSLLSTRAIACCALAILTSCILYTLSIIVDLFLRLPVSFLWMFTLDGMAAHFIWFLPLAPPIEEVIDPYVKLSCNIGLMGTTVCSCSFYFFISYLPSKGSISF